MPTYEATTSDWSCIFCAIASGNIQPMWNAIIYEDDAHMAWLSPFPNTLGKTVVIPKSHYGSDVMKLPDQALICLIKVAKHVSSLLEDAFDDVGRVWVLMEWTWIDHAHIKLFPMHGTWHMKHWERKQYLSHEEVYIHSYTWYITSKEWPRMSDQQLAKLKQRICRHQTLTDFL